MEIPCKECIILAMCKNKHEVRCDILNTLAFTVCTDNKAILKWWDLVHTYLPTLDRIRNSEGG